MFSPHVKFTANMSKMTARECRYDRHLTVLVTLGAKGWHRSSFKKFDFKKCYFEMDFGSNIINTYLSLIENVEFLESFYNRGTPIPYPTIHQELLNCCSKIDEIIALETTSGSFLMALFQQKQQFTLLIDLIEKITKNKIPHKQWGLDDPDFYNKPPPAKKTKYDPPKNDKLDVIKNKIVIPKVRGFVDIFGLHEIKKTLKTLVILPKTQPQLFYDRRVSNSLLLYGPPGTGKTRLVHALAAEAAAKFYCISAGDVLSQYVGQTEKTIKTLFQFMKNSSEYNILFIDEIDAFCRRRTGNEQDYTRRIKTEFMCEMSGVEDCSHLFVICATNCPWDLDSAILRRLQKRIYVPLPNPVERMEFFQHLTKNYHFDPNLTDWAFMVEKTEGYSGSDLNDVVQSALNIPLNELEDTKIWKCTIDGFYEPVLGEQDFSDVICSELRDLPPNSVRARKVQMNDLLNAVDTVSSTVTQSDVKNYEIFNGV